MSFLIINRQLGIPFFPQNRDTYIIRIKKMTNGTQAKALSVNYRFRIFETTYVRHSRLYRNDLKIHVDRPRGGFKKRIFGRYRHLTIYYHIWIRRGGWGGLSSG